MLLLALLERDADKLDPKLQADVEALRIQLPLLLEEILKVSGAWQVWECWPAPLLMACGAAAGSNSEGVGWAASLGMLRFAI